MSVYDKTAYKEMKAKIPHFAEERVNILGEEVIILYNPNLYTKQKVLKSYDPNKKWTMTKLENMCSDYQPYACTAEVLISDSLEAKLRNVPISKVLKEKKEYQDIINYFRSPEQQARAQAKIKEINDKLGF